MIYHQYGNMVVDTTNQQSAVILAEMVPFQVPYSHRLLNHLQTDKPTVPLTQPSSSTAELPSDTKDVSLNKHLIQRSPLVL